LIDGLSGYLVFKANYNLLLNLHSSNLNFLLNKVFNELSNQTIDGSLMYGLSGVAFSYKEYASLFDNLNQEIIGDFETYITKSIDKNIKMANFDLFTGYLGEILVLITGNTQKHEVIQKSIQLIIESLNLTSIERNDGIGWFLARNISHLYPNISDVNKIPKDFNLGMAHGIPSIISTLNFIFNYNSNNADAFNLCTKALNYLESEKVLNEFGYYFKNYSGISSKIYPSRLSWCYSDLGISLMYLNLYKATLNNEFLDFSIKLASNTTKIPFERTIVRDGGLCHGASGIAHMYNRLYQTTSLSIFSDAAIKWYEILLNKYYNQGACKASFLAYSSISDGNDKEYKENYGLLNGMSGIGLSLISGLSNREPTWDRCLLLS
jgi:hypothetical protein